MKVKLPRFRNFIVKCERALGTPSWLEMAMNHAIVDEMPISQTIANVLSVIPGGPAAQKAALKYIYNDGLYQASQGRHELAQIASERLGRHVDDWEVFSPERHQEDPALGELYKKELEPLYFQNYEPKTIPITPKQHVFLDQLNKVLEKHGLKPFHFGGPSGVIEYMENGKWNRRMTHGSPTGTPAGERHGVDVSKPEYIEYPDRPGKYQFKFNTWEPPDYEEFYGRTLDGLRSHSQKHIGNLHSGKDQDFLAGHEDADSVRNFWKSHGQQDSSVSQSSVPFSTGGRTAHQFDDQEEFNHWAEILKKGLEVANAARREKMPRGNIPAYSEGEQLGMEWAPEQIHDMLYGRTEKPQIPPLLDPQNLTIWSLTFEPIQRTHAARLGLKNDRNYIKAASVVNAAQKSGAANLSKSNAYSANVDAKDYVGEPDYDRIELKNPEAEIKDLMAQGYRYTGSKARFGDPNVVRIRLQRGNEPILHIEKSHDDGKWYILSPTSRKKNNRAVKLQGTPGVLGGYVHRDSVTGLPDKARSYGTFHSPQPGGGRETFPLSRELQTKARDDFNNNPEAYGDDLVGIPELGGAMIPKSVQMAAKWGLGRAARTLNMEPYEIENNLQSQRGSDLWSIAWMAMDGLMGSWKFKYGEPNKEFQSKGNTDIRSLLTSVAGIQDEAQKEEIINNFYAAVTKHGGEAGLSPELFGGNENIIKAFLKNGMYWRADQAANRVADDISYRINQQRREGANKSVKGKDGEETDTLSQNADAGDREGLVTSRKVSRQLDPSQRTDVGASILNQRVASQAEQEKTTPFFTHRGYKDGHNTPGYKNNYENVTTSLNANSDNPGPYLLGIARSLGKADPMHRAGTVDAMGDFIAKLFNDTLKGGDVADRQAVEKLAPVYRSFIANDALSHLAASTELPEAGQKVVANIKARWDRRPSCRPSLSGGWTMVVCISIRMLGTWLLRNRLWLTRPLMASTRRLSRLRCGARNISKLSRAATTIRPMLC